MTDHIFQPNVISRHRRNENNREQNLFDKRKRRRKERQKTRRLTAAKQGKRPNQAWWPR